MDKLQKKVWKVAVVGCGAFANWQYLPNIRKEANAEIVAAVDIIPERAQKRVRIIIFRIGTRAFMNLSKNAILILR